MKNALLWPCRQGDGAGPSGAQLPHAGLAFLDFAAGPRKLFQANRPIAAIGEGDRGVGNAVNGTPFRDAAAASPARRRLPAFRNSLDQE